jgi:hypothetical protein
MLKKDAIYIGFVLHRNIFCCTCEIHSDTFVVQDLKALWELSRVQTHESA